MRRHQNKLPEIRAEAGEILREQGRKQGQRDETFHGETFTPKLEDLGITRQQSHRWQRVCRRSDSARWLATAKGASHSA